jgi:hypothetical protein
VLDPYDLDGIVWLCLDIKEFVIGRLLFQNLVLDLCKELFGNGIIINLGDVGAEVLGRNSAGLSDYQRKLFINFRFEAIETAI